MRLKSDFLRLLSLSGAGLCEAMICGTQPVAPVTWREGSVPPSFMNTRPGTTKTRLISAVPRLATHVSKVSYESRIP